MRLIVGYTLSLLCSLSGFSLNLYISSFALNAFIERGTLMSWTDWTLLGVFIAGFLLFLYGANTYNAVVGYTGIYLFIGSIAAYVVLYIYKELIKKQTTPPQKP